MIILLEFKEWLKAVYAKHAGIVTALVKFVYSFVAFTLMNLNIGYMTKLKNPLIAAALSVVCAFLPYGAICFIAATFMLFHIYSISFEIALITAVVMIVIALLYYGFQPGDSFWLILTPIALLLKVPFAIPVLAGLSGSLVSVIPVSCGVLVYYILQYVKQNAGVLTNDTSVDITQKYVQLIKTLLTNKMMIVMIAACAVGVLCAYLIHQLSVDYAWFIAIVASSIAQVAVIFIGDLLADVAYSAVELVLGVVLSLVICGIYHFFVFAVDYSRTEYTQFEDDDYVYYVKAVPKIVVTRADVKVQRINTRNGQRGERSMR